MSVLRIYDIQTDGFRDATQEDIDALWTVSAAMMAKRAPEDVQAKLESSLERIMRKDYESN